MASPLTIESLTIAEVRTAARDLADHVVTTPVHRLRTGELADALGDATDVWLKLELFQHTGTFKARGALLNVLNLSEQERQRGVIAVSAGNHAAAVAFAAATVGISAKVVMFASANRMRVELCRSLGADIVFAATAHAGFELATRLAEQEGRTLVHPFEGRITARGTATVGLETCEQIPGLQAVIVPIGGGGLCAGIASAVKLLEPGCEVFGVEPEGADSMHRSFAAGEPRAIERVATIADSLGAPYALPISFELCRRNVDGLVRVSDSELRAAMRFLMRNAKLAVEPAGAAATAALLGPLRERLRGKRVGVIVCGSNIDPESYAGLIAASE